MSFGVRLYIQQEMNTACETKGAAAITEFGQLVIGPFPDIPILMSGAGGIPVVL